MCVEGCRVYMEVFDNKAEVEPSYLSLKGAEGQLRVLGNP